VKGVRRRRPVPIAVALTVIAYRRTDNRRGFIFWFGTLASGAVTIAGLGAVVVLLAAWVE
jgi:hypothetical protein